MAARKIFHVWVGFWFANIVFISIYLVVSGLYVLFTHTPDNANNTLFFVLPRFAMILSAPWPWAS